MLSVVFQDLAVLRQRRKNGQRRISRETHFSRRGLCGSSCSASDDKSQNQRLNGKQDAGARTPTGLRTHHNGHVLWRIRDLRFRSRVFVACVRGVSLPHASAAFPNAHGCCLHLVGFVRAWLCCQNEKAKSEGGGEGFPERMSLGDRVSQDLLQRCVAWLFEFA